MQPYDYDVASLSLFSVAPKRCRPASTEQACPGRLDLLGLDVFLYGLQRGFSGFSLFLRKRTRRVGHIP